MKIWIKTYASLGNLDKEIDVEEGISIEHLIEKLELSPGSIFLILVNGNKSETDTVLKDSDRVSLFPSIGGG